MKKYGKSPMVSAIPAMKKLNEITATEIQKLWEQKAKEPSPFDPFFNTMCATLVKILKKHGIVK